MDEKGNVVRLRQADAIDDPLTEVMRAGFRQSLAQAVGREVFPAERAGLRLPTDGLASSATGLLGGVGTGLAPLPRAVRLQRVASTVGFDWTDPRAVLAKIREETDEIEAALGDTEAVRDELGDLLFAVADLARHVQVDPEAALAGANRRFERRFGPLERGLAARGSGFEEADLDTMEALWSDAKAAERG